MTNKTLTILTLFILSFAISSSSARKLRGQLLQHKKANLEHELNTVIPVIPVDPAPLPETQTYIPGNSATNYRITTSAIEPPRSLIEFVPGTGDVGSLINGATGAAVGALTATTLGPAAIGVVKHFPGAVVDAVGSVTDGVGDATDAIGGIVGDVVGAVTDAAGDAVDAAGDVVDDVGGAVEDAAGAVGDVVGDAAGAVGDAAGAVGDAVGDAAGAVGDAVGDVGDALCFFC